MGSVWGWNRLFYLMDFASPLLSDKIIRCKRTCTLVKNRGPRPFARKGIRFNEMNGDTLPRFLTRGVFAVHIQYSAPGYG